MIAALVTLVLLVGALVGFLIRALRERDEARLDLAYQRERGLRLVADLTTTRAELGRVSAELGRRRVEPTEADLRALSAVKLMQLSRALRAEEQRRACPNPTWMQRTLEAS